MDDIKPTPFDADVRDHRAEAELDALLATHRRVGVLLQRPYPPSTAPRVRSRLGGLPQLPAHIDWPIGALRGEQTPMHFLAQIDCAELPPVCADMPRQGMLFFFAVNAEEQRWDEGEPADSVRVLYVAGVALDTPVRQPPAALQPILSIVASEHPSSRLCWLLPDEDGPRIHAHWPLLAHRIDTWPDYCMLPDAAPRPDYVRYQRRLAQLRLGAAVAATGLMSNLDFTPPWARPMSMPWTFPVDWLRQQEAFPQAGILVDRIARVIGRRRWRSGERRVAEDVLGWIRRAEAIGMDGVPDPEDRQAFRAWLVEQIGTGDDAALGDSDLGDALTRGMLAAIACTGGSAHTARLIPDDVYEYLEDHHLSFERTWTHERDGARLRSEANLHQMLGHPVLLQDMVPDTESEPVCLLQLASDDAIDLRFGDCGMATFWIDREDLANLRFDRVVGIVESC
ncbi:DUF1963 domain-containing protein [Xanthomonas medicagonis]|uniref:DUF1963 domain-containing protein n=1 Tax=Xanthomonas medicagonis TaxID=3160841 RepID=UPI003519400E